MISIRVDSSEVRKYLDAYPKAAARALETAIDKTAADIKKGEIDEMRSVFDNPTAYTLNSLKLTRTKGHNMVATVGFKEPPRMTDSYLVPEVEGGERKAKGFERGIGSKFVPGKGAERDQYNNIKVGQIRKMLRIIKAQGNALPATKRKGRTKQRMYVYLPVGSSRGKLLPGIYQRVGDKQRFLTPIVVRGWQHAKYKQRLKFYDVAQKIHGNVFEKYFFADLSGRLP